jgi:hypothetical protein
MKRIKFNTTWEEDEEERRVFFASLNYPERLKYYLKSRKLLSLFRIPPVEKDDLRLCDNYRIPERIIVNF